jgi:excisionase family DNA binding protein
MTTYSSTSTPPIHPDCEAAHNELTMTTINANLRPASPWLSIDDLAEYVRSPKATIYRWRYLGEGPAARGKAGRRPLYHQADVDAWVEQQGAL